MLDKEQNFFQKLNPNYAWRITKAIVELGPHKIAGTKLEQDTTQWIMKEMERIGLIRVAMEPFPVTVRDLSEPGSVVIHGGPTLTTWSMPGSWGTPEEGFTGELVYVEEGKASDYAHGVDVKDKIVLYKRRWPDMAGEDGIFRSTPALEAITRGAKATITFDDVGPADAARIQIMLLGKDGYKIKVPCIVIASRDADQLITLLKEKPIDVTVHSNIEDPHPGTSHNVIGYIPGKRYPDELVILSSHYDTWWYGAADSISGIGAILGIAKALIEAEIQPDRTIVFVAHGAEEQGGETWFDWLIGSYNNIVKNHSDWAGRIVANLNIDCISFRPEDCTLECSFELLPLVRDVYSKHGKKGIVFEETSPTTVLTYTDSAAYIMRGVPSANIMFWPEEYWRYYHTQYDDIAIVTEASLQYAMELWGSATLRASKGSTLVTSIECALEKLADALIQNRLLLAEAGLDTRSTADALTRLYTAVADAKTLTQSIPKFTDHKDDIEALNKTIRKCHLSVIKRLNADMHIIGGSFGFQMFYTPDPYARDASHIKRAIRALNVGDSQTACQELEMVYAMRAAGRYMSRRAYNLYIEHLWEKPEFWCTRLQRYVDVWDQWASIHENKAEDLIPVLAEKCDESIDTYNEMLTSLNGIIAEIRHELSTALIAVEAALNETK